MAKCSQLTPLPFNPLKPKPQIITLCHTGLTYRFFISDIWALWPSALSARVPDCQKSKMVG